MTALENGKKTYLVTQGYDREEVPVFLEILRVCRVKKLTPFERLGEYRLHD